VLGFEPKTYMDPKASVLPTTPQRPTVQCPLWAIIIPMTFDPALDL